MRWIKRAIVALALLIMVALALPFFIPLGSWIPRIEQEASALLGQPVTVSAVRLAFLPVPHVNVEGISVGKTGDIRIGKVSVTPALLSLFSSPRVLRNITIDSPVLNQQGMAVLTK